MNKGQKPPIITESQIDQAFSGDNPLMAIFNIPQE
jgi:hypothetical protein